MKNTFKIMVLGLVLVLSYFDVKADCPKGKKLIKSKFTANLVCATPEEAEVAEEK